MLHTANLVIVTLSWPLLKDGLVPYLEHLNGLLADLHPPRLEDLHAPEVLQREKGKGVAVNYCNVLCTMAKLQSFSSNKGLFRIRNLLTNNLSDEKANFSASTISFR